MYKNGHRGINAMAGAVVAFTLAAGGILANEVALLAGLGVIGLARIPDWDRHFDKSMDSHRSDLLHYIPISHRGITHTVWFSFLVGAVFAGGGILIAEATGGSAILYGAVGGAVGTIGIVAHIIGDALTPAGVRPFSPIKRTKYTVAMTRADSTFWNTTFLAIGAITFLGVTYLLVEIENTQIPI